MNLQHTEQEFPTTQWTLIQAIQSDDCDARDAARRRICELYWPAVYAYLRRIQGLGRDEAADLTQQYFTDVIVRRELLENLAPTNNRLRTIVLRTLDRFHTDQRRYANAQKRSPGTPLISLESFGQVDGPVQQGESPEAAFERQWTAQVIQAAIDQCDAHYRKSSSASYRGWKAFEAQAIRPALSGNKRQDSKMLADELGFTNSTHANAMIYLVKQKFHEVLQHVISQSVTDHEALKEELERVHAALATAG